MSTKLRALTAIAAVAVLISLGLAFFRYRQAAHVTFVEYPMLRPNDIPATVAAGPDGAVWFTIEFSDAIGVLRHGKIERLIKGRQNVEPLGLAVDSSGSVWYTDAPTQSIGRISANGETASFPLGTPIARLGRLAVGPDGAVWFAETTAYSITRLRDGTLTRNTFASPRGGPFGVAAGKDGSIWATLHAANQVLHIGTNGAMTEFDVPTPASGPTDIAVDAQGAVWFLEYRANKIGRFFNGKFSESAAPLKNCALTGLAIAPDGSVWFGMLREHSLGRLRGSAIKTFPLPRPTARPYSVAVDPNGNVWYADITGYLGMLPAADAMAN
jgi:virginiamycin B lyase